MQGLERFRGAGTDECLKHQAVDEDSVPPTKHDGEMTRRLAAWTKRFTGVPAGHRDFATAVLIDALIGLNAVQAANAAEIAHLVLALAADD